MVASVGTVIVAIRVAAVHEEYVHVSGTAVHPSSFTLWTLPATRESVISAFVIEVSASATVTSASFKCFTGVEGAPAPGVPSTTTIDGAN